MNNVKSKNSPLVRHIEIQYEVKKNLRAPPNNSLLQRPNDGPVHSRNAGGAQRLTAKNPEVKEQQFTSMSVHSQISCDAPSV